MILKPKKVVSITITVITLLLALPASAILTSWNSQPGDMLYPVKRSLEKTALAITPNSLLEAKLHFAFLDRRAKEAGIALIQEPNDQQVLDDILTEAIAAQITTTSLEPEQQTIATLELIQKVNQASEQLDQAKKTISYSSPTSPVLEIEQSLPTQPTLVTNSNPPLIEPAPAESLDPTPTVTAPVETSEPSEPIIDPVVTTPKITSSAPTITPQKSTSSITKTQIELSKIVIKAEQKLQKQNLNQEHQKKLKKIKEEHQEKLKKIKEDDNKEQEQEREKNENKKKKRKDD
jgi:hypothetical protein